MTGNKYILTSTNEYAIFSPTTEHSKIAKMLKGKVIGAGFCSVMSEYDELGNDITLVECWGESISLDIISNEDDGIKISDIMNQCNSGY